MIGPIQLVITGFTARHIPPPLLAKMRELRSEPAVRIIDALTAYRNRDGTVETEPVTELIPEPIREPGALLTRLLTSAGAASTLGQTSNTGPRYLFQNDPLPDPRMLGPAGTGALAVLLEHRWAIPLRDAAAESKVYPIAAVWLGRDALLDVALLSANS